MTTLNMNWGFEGADIHTLWISIVFIGIGYLFGSFLFSRFYISTFKGGDTTYIDNEGNRKEMPRFGTSWTWRVFGAKIGLTHFFTDFGKAIIGYWGVIFPLMAFVPIFGSGIPLLFFVGALIGNNWPVWWKFKGGVGIAVAVGGMMSINWLAAISGIVVWAIFLKVTKQTGLSALLGGFFVVAISFVPAIGANSIFVYSPLYDILDSQAQMLTVGFPMSLCITIVVGIMFLKRAKAIKSYGRLFKRLLTMNFKDAKGIGENRFNSADDN